MNHPSTAVDPHDLIAGTETPTRTSRMLVPAATAGAVGGIVLFCDLALRAFGALGQVYYPLAAVMALCLLGVPATYWIRGAIGTGWLRGIAVTGTGVILLGTVAWITAFTILFVDPDRAFSQRLTPAGSVLLALGMLMFGVAVVASRRPSGWWAWAPLIVGAYFPVQLAIQLAFFLGGKDSAPGPNGALLGAWGLLWAWAAWAGVTATKRR
ncbi:MAG: hypothetical protein ABWZ98_15615 [Nakamurella sp.]